MQDTQKSLTTRRISARWLETETGMAVAGCVMVGRQGDGAWGQPIVNEVPLYDTVCSLSTDTHLSTITDADPHMFPAPWFQIRATVAA
ncbi:hypothetical protein BRADI_5g08273v3 [Brachypodium distachyon]|uniref:Uncharacterized protein n=1 Tax=Brachypodium distachyon TaxID=15368 RepID=A0A0Q3E3C0_BRADI|nr:hypothetical protein BRADI_5g08273v3 [Brachypodium distachyon]